MVRKTMNELSFEGVIHPKPCHGAGKAMNELASEGHDGHPAFRDSGNQVGPSKPLAALDCPRQEDRKETLVIQAVPSSDSETRRPSAKSHDSGELPMGKTTSLESRLSRHRASLFTKVDPLSLKIMFFGAMLAACAGMTNAVSFRALGAFVSHVTGTLSKVGLHAQDSAFSDAGESILLVFSFAIGSVICGCMISRNTVTLGNELYGLALIGNASLLFLAILTAEHKVAPYLLAAACGLQNGMATSYSGAVIRTTHATGLCTDVGLIIGRNSRAFLRKHCCPTGSAEKKEDHMADCRKLLLLLLLGTSFLLGVFVGAALHAAVGVTALLLPAFLLVTSGTAYTLYRVCLLHQPFFGTDLQASEEAKPEVQESRARPSDSKDGAASPRSPLAPPASKQPAGHEPLKLKDVNGPVRCKAVTAGTPSSETVVRSRTPAEGGPMERLLAMVDALEPSLAKIPPGSVPGQSDLQAEALEAHRRLRSVVSELSSQDDPSGCNV